MEKEKFFETLSNYHPISAGLKAYLDYILKAQHLPSGLIQSTANFIEQPLLFIQHGSLRLFALDEEERKEYTLRFFPEGTFLFPSHYLKARDMPTFLHAIDEVTILGFDQRHLYILYHNFREFSTIIELLHRSEIQRMLYHSFMLQNTNASQAYADFIRKYPSIAKSSQLQHIASYLGIDNRTLSRIRR